LPCRAAAAIKHSDEGGSGRHDVRKAVWIAVSLGLLLAGAGFLAVLVSAVPSPRHGSGEPSSIEGRAAPGAKSRQVYSPIIAKDPYVIDQWEKSIQALEAACTQRGEYCEEAQKARLSVNR
jgi:hypothetical protein